MWRIVTLLNKQRLINESIIIFYNWDFGNVQQQEALSSISLVFNLCIGLSPEGEKNQRKKIEESNPPSMVWRRKIFLFLRTLQAIITLSTNFYAVWMEFHRYDLLFRVWCLWFPAKPWRKCESLSVGISFFWVKERLVWEVKGRGKHLIWTADHRPHSLPHRNTS